MKQATFFKIAIATNICFLFLIVQKSSKSIQLSYDRQKILNEKEALTHRQTELTHQLYASKSLSKIKQFALNNLGMKPCTIKQVKPLELAAHTESPTTLQDVQPHTQTPLSHQNTPTKQSAQSGLSSKPNRITPHNPTHGVS
jgi:hypothetical protein